MKLVVVDLEATCWAADTDPALAANQRNETEIIEIGAVRLDWDSLDQLDALQAFVRPTRHPTLSVFCTGLTTITQAQVDASPTLPEVWPRFVDWMGGDDDTVLASWGAYDANQLHLEARRHSLAKPRWTPLNLKRAYADHLKRTGPRRARYRTGLQTALSHLGWEFEGTPHRALADARNAARIYQHIRHVAALTSG